MNFFGSFTKKDLHEFLETTKAKLGFYCQNYPIPLILLSFCLGYVCALLGKLFFAALILLLIIFIGFYLALPETGQKNAKDESETEAETKT
ncbi:MAG: hypothetical protein NZT61_03735 [Deltaproteobacteria bacterium]|nr:hypothetical protein [Deltaproteobacteria bacterium]MCX7952623.1 hypothetical protein [Deltaproteobacteria bacterium]